MNQLKIGDRIAYGNGPCQRFKGLFGTISGLSEDSWFLVDFDNGTDLQVKCADIWLSKIENRKPENLGDASVKLILTDGFYLRTAMGSARLGDEHFDLSLVGCNIMVEDREQHRYILIEVTDAVKSAAAKLIEMRK
jgi:hypothetical protein